MTSGDGYYLMLWAVDNFGNETPSSVVSELINQAPNAPTNLGFAAYVQGGWINAIRPILTFSLSDPNTLDTVRYYIEIANTANFSSPVVQYTSSAATQGSRTFTVGQSAGSGTYTTGSSNQSLAEGTYYWRVRAIDQFGVTSPYSTANAGSVAFNLDTTAPTVPGIPSATTVPGSNKPTWNWTASTDASSGLSATTPYTVQWSRSSSFTSGVFSSNSTTTSFTHSDGLADGTWYFRVRARDKAGNASAYGQHGTVLVDDGLPVISSVGYSITESTITITWVTDEPSTPVVRWGTTPSYGNTYSSQTYSTSHSVTISKLNSATLYFLQIQSFDEAGNSDSISTTKLTSAATISETKATEETFVATAITQLSVSIDSFTQATVSWITNHPANSTVNYGITTALGQQVRYTDLTTSHSVKLVGLQPGATYYYQVRSDGNSMASVGIRVFTMPLQSMLYVELPSKTATESAQIQEVPAILQDQTQTDGTRSQNIIRKLDTLLETSPTVSQITTTIVESASNPVVATTVTSVGIAVVAAPSVPFAVTAVSQNQSLWALIGLLAGLLRRKRYPWGVVYDSVTKEPIASALVMLRNNKEVVQSVLTDVYGRYEFLVPSGIYTIEVRKNGFLFPSKVLASDTSDEVYEDLYHGGSFKLSEKDKLKANIPLDVVSKTAKSSSAMFLAKVFTKAELIKNSGVFLSRLLFAICFIYTVSVYYLYPSWINAVLLGLFALIFIASLFRQVSRGWGSVKDNRNKVVRGAKLTLVNVRDPGRNHAAAVTDHLGRFNFLVTPGSYKINVYLRNKQGKYLFVHATPIIQVKDARGVLNPDIRLS